MFKKKINLIDYLIVSFLIFVQVFYFHIYNSIEKSLNVILAFIILIFSIYISFKFITINFISNLEIGKKIILIALLIISLFKFFILSDAYYNFDSDLLYILSKNTFDIFIFFDLFMLLSFIFFILILQKIRLNFIKIFFILFWIAALLFTVSLFYLLLFKPQGHEGWLNPFIYLFFYNDNVSSKLQHSYIYLLISMPLIHNMYQSKKVIFKIIFILSIYFIFFMFSKLFITLLLLFIFGYNILYCNKENITLTVKLFLISVTIIVTSFFCFNSFFGKNTNIINQLQLKFSRILYFSNFIDEINIKYITSAPSFIKLKDKSIDAQINYYDSSSDRFNRFKFCTEDGLKYKSFKYFPIVKISKNYAHGELKSDYFQNEFDEKKYFFINCEGSLIQIYYQYESLSVFLYLVLFLLLLYFFKKKDNFTILSYSIVIIASIQHLSFDNPITYFYLAFLIIQNENNFKKIDLKTSLQN
jgi:hypothetical protein